MTGIPNRSPRQRRQDEFRAAMAGEDVVLFVRDVLTAVEPIIGDKTLGPKQRCLADWKRQSWANFSLYCIKDEEGTTYTRADTARKLKLSESTVSRVVSYYEARGYIRTDGQKIIPVIRPQLTDLPPKLAYSASFDLFLEHWKLADSASFEAWASAKAALELAKSAARPLEKVALSAYRDWGRAQEKDPLIKNVRTTEESEDAEASSSSGISLISDATTTPFDPPSEAETPPAAVALEAGIIRMFVVAGKDNPTPRQIAEAVAALPNDPGAHAAFLESLRPKMARVKHPGVLMSLVAGFNVGWPEERERRKREKQDAEDRAAEQVRLEEEARVWIAAHSDEYDDAMPARREAGSERNEEEEKAKGQGG